jgi:hypothetical protein
MPAQTERLTMANMREHFANQTFPNEEARRQTIEAAFWREMEADALGFLGQQKPLPAKKVNAKIVGDSKTLSFETLTEAMVESTKLTWSHIIQSTDGKGNWTTIGGRDVNERSAYDDPQPPHVPQPRRRSRS